MKTVEIRSDQDGALDQMDALWREVRETARSGDFVINMLKLEDGSRSMTVVVSPRESDQDVLSGVLQIDSEVEDPPQVEVPPADDSVDDGQAEGEGPTVVDSPVTE